jgi:hypothetical protein
MNFDSQRFFIELRNVKCHNWAYVKPALLKLLQAMETTSKLEQHE